MADTTITFDRLLVPLPDLPGKVHGIVGLDPPKVQCDGCGMVATGPAGGLAYTVLQTRFKFNSFRIEGDHRRLCPECAEAAWGKGWDH